jgi:predicted lactoylglutathione lyase
VGDDEHTPTLSFILDIAHKEVKKEVMAAAGRKSEAEVDEVVTNALENNTRVVGFLLPLLGTLLHFSSF